MLCLPLKLNLKTFRIIQKAVQAWPGWGQAGGWRQVPWYVLAAVEEVFPEAQYQRCTAHFYHEVFSVTPGSIVKLVLLDGS